MPDDNSNPLQERPPTFRAALMNMNPKIALAFFLVFVASVMVLIWMVKPPRTGPDGVDAGTVALIASMITLFIKMAADAIGYQYSSSSGSDKKDDIQAGVAATLANKVAAPVPVQVPMSTDQLGESMLTNGDLIYFKALTNEDAKKAFIAMSASERAATIAKG